MADNHEQYTGTFKLLSCMDYQNQKDITESSEVFA